MCLKGVVLCSSFNTREFSTREVVELFVNFSPRQTYDTLLGQNYCSVRPLPAQIHQDPYWRGCSIVV